MRKEIKIIIEVFSNIIICFILSILLKYSKVMDYLNIYEIVLISILTSIVIYNTGYLIINKECDLSRLVIYIASYLFLLFMLLIYRKSKDDLIFNDKLYLKEWLKIVFTNRIVFINIFGNLLLFIPLGIILTKIKINLWYQLFLSIVIITCIELIQYFGKLGVFDIYDIILNFVGVIMGLLLYRKLDLWMNSKKMMKNKT